MEKFLNAFILLNLARLFLYLNVKLNTENICIETKQGRREII